jgi:hypothetical protein
MHSYTWLGCLFSNGAWSEISNPVEKNEQGSRFLQLPWVNNAKLAFLQTRTSKDTGGTKTPSPFPYLYAIPTS